MTEDEALIVRYLQKFAGQFVEFHEMLNILRDAKTGYVRGRFHVDREVQRKTWVDLRRAANRLIKADIIVMRCGPMVQGYRGHRKIRLHAAFERKSVL